MMSKLDAASAQVTQAGSVITFVSAIFGWLVENSAEISVVGLLCGIALSIAGIVFQVRRDRRESALHEKRMEERLRHARD
ncbi:hypothetical protein TDB9533_01245 [Thalassocella blandensis]|nr:hypothetical protein TDB9533_01245 [Thalassocella blandensis]